MNISNQSLVETYRKAIQLNLDQDFILLLEEELKLRGLMELIENGS